MPEHSILLAHAEVRDTVDLDRRAPTRLELEAGKEVRLRMSYHLVDGASVEEQWHVRMVLQVDDQEEQVQDVVHKDAAGSIDDRLSNLHMDLAFAPGDHDVTYAIEVGLVARSWDDGQTLNRETVRRVEGTIQVHAR